MFALDKYCLINYMSSHQASNPILWKALHEI